MSDRAAAFLLALRANDQPDPATRDRIWRRIATSLRPRRVVLVVFPYSLQVGAKLPADVDTSIALVSHLRERGHRVLVAFDEVEAKRALRTHAIDALVLHASQRYAATLIARSRLRGSAVRVVVLAPAEDHAVEHGWRAGADAVLVTPALEHVEQELVGIRPTHRKEM